MKHPQLKDVVIKILGIIEYNEDKEKFANEFVRLCQQRALLSLIPTLPQDKQPQLRDFLTASPNPQLLDKMLSELFAEGVYAQALQKANSEIFEGYINTIYPTLTDKQKNELKIYFQSIT